MQTLEDAVARLLASYAAAVRAKDVEAFIALYNPKVRVFDAWGVWSYEGAQAWQIAVEGWFASLGTETVKVSFDDVQMAGTGELAGVSAIVTYAATSAQGAEIRAMQNRLSWLLRTSGHVLRIVHEHTSAPIGFEDTKAILRKEHAA